MRTPYVAAVGSFAAVFAILFGCSSEPCEGDACPGACNGADCAAGSSGTSGGSGSAMGGRLVPCHRDDQCDVEHGFSCAAGTCLYACQTHFDCRGVGLCEAPESGGKTYCVPTEDNASLPGPGQYYSHCPQTSECDADAGFICRGSGIGDLDAYCTADCSSDEECPNGFGCDTLTATPCDDACQVAGDSGNPACIPVEEISADGPYRCGDLGVERSLCVERKFCSECETDEDCRAVPGQLCAKDRSGEKICTKPCDPGLDTCPWGNAAECDVWDEELGFATCSHRFGACQGKGKSCEPCSRREDCGPTGVCFGSSFTGERYCVDLSVSCDCSGQIVTAGTCDGGGCPETPGGLSMLCVAQSGICLGATTNPSVIGESPQLGCWPEP